MDSAIITGSTGFIGSYFVEHLLSEGIEVLALGRKDFETVSETRKSRLKNATYLNVPMENIGALPDVVREMGWKSGSDCVFFNLAWGGENRLSDLNVGKQMDNAVYSEEALNCAARLGCHRFIQVGTMEEAFTHRYFPLDYSTDTKYNRHLVYSAAKIAARNVLDIKSRMLGLDFVYVLHSHVMAPDDDKDSFLQVTLQKLINAEDLVLSSGEQLFDVVSAKDCVLGYYLICKKGRPGTAYWVGSGAPRRLREYVERMYAMYPSGKPLSFGSLPYNDIVLDEEDFSIATLTAHTGFRPRMSYEEIVEELHDYLASRNA
jgi:nucleoside-diphosphate-sugar epimerase